MEVAVLLEPTHADVRSGVPMKKASAPKARQARAKTLANIIFDSGREEKRKERKVGRRWNSTRWQRDILGVHRRYQFVWYTSTQGPFDPRCP